MTKIVDFFPYFDPTGKEILELRYNILKDHVDEFVICESNKTQSGVPIEYGLRKTLEELNIPTDKIKIIDLKIPEDEYLIINDIDRINCYEGNNQNLNSLRSRVRERMQKDSLLRVLKDYDEDTVFIHSDMDEIINPEYLSWIIPIIKNSLSHVIRIPLVHLEGRADLRVYLKDTNTPKPWTGMFICTKMHLRNATPTQIRSNANNPYPIGYINHDGVNIEDLGWHFSWMGSAERRIAKSQAFTHYDDTFSFLENKKYTDDGTKKFLENLELEEGSISPSGEVNTILKNYPQENLPKIIFDLPRVKEFLLPDRPVKKSAREKIADLYQKFDSIYGDQWGWCTLEKAYLMMDCVEEISKDIDNPVCVEIGVFGGKSLFPLASSLMELGKGVVHGIDPWTTEASLEGYEGPHHNYWKSIPFDEVYGRFIKGLDELNLHDYVNIIKQKSDDAPEIDNICFLHVDGQHTEQAVRDINKYGPKVIEGGYCIMDDVEWSDGTREAVLSIESLGFEKVLPIEGGLLYKKTIDQSQPISPFTFASNKKPTVWIVDNFYDDPHAVREFALQQEYVEGGFGRGFIGRRTEQQFLWPGLKESFEEIIGQKITAWETHPMNGRFQNAHSGEPLVWHCDSQKWGGMLYLTPGAPYQCGTSLYATKKDGARTYFDPGWDIAWAGVPGGCHLDGTYFEPVDVCGNVFNRLFIFDASCIHSASEYFGTVMENSRLWQMFFFDTQISTK